MIVICLGFPAVFVLPLCVRLPSVFSDYGISGKNSGIDGHISLAYLPTPKRRVPYGQSVISQLGIDAVVAVAVDKMRES